MFASYLIYNKWTHTHTHITKSWWGMRSAVKSMNICRRKWLIEMSLFHKKIKKKFGNYSSWDVMMSEEKRERKRIDFTLSLNVKCSQVISRIRWQSIISLIYTYISQFYLNETFTVCVSPSPLASFLSSSIHFQNFPLVFPSSFHTINHHCRHKFALSHILMSGGCFCLFFVYVLFLFYWITTLSEQIFSRLYSCVNPCFIEYHEQRNCLLTQPIISLFNLK